MQNALIRIKALPLLAKAALAVFVALAPFIITADYLIHILISVLMYVILTLSLNLVTGYAGQFSIGHAAFYGIGAYVAALLMLNQGVSFWLAMLASGVITAVFGFILGLPALRLQGDYLGIVTLGFGEIVRLIFMNWVSVTRGPMGLPGIPAPTIGSYEFASKTPYYYLILALTVLTLFVMHRVTTSRYGLSLMTVREDEIAASAVGINTTRAKLTAFIVGAFFAGIVGAFFAVYLSFISPDSFMYADSITILSMVVLGGMGNIVGSVLGALVLVVAPEMLRFLVDYRMILYGLMMVAVMIFKPEGFWGISRRRRNTWLKPSDQVPAVPEKGGRTHENA